jgi:flagellar assembly factor FliW
MTRLAFVEPPYGLGPTLDFDLEPVEGAAGLFTLVGGGLRLFLLDAGAHLPAYRPEPSRMDVAALGGPEALSTFVVVNPSEGAWNVNLAAPVLVAADGRARQVILDRGDWPVRMPLAEAVAA